MPRPKITFLGTQIEVAGAQRMLLAQAKWFKAHGYDVEAVFFYDKEGLLTSWKKSHDFELVSLNGWISGDSFWSNGLRLMRALKSLLAKLRASDVLVTYTPHSNALGLPVGWPGVPVRIGTHHGYIEGSGRILARVHGWLANSKLSTKMVSVSTQVRDYMLREEKVRESKIVVIENGVEAIDLAQVAADRQMVRTQLGLKDNELMLLTVGRLTIQKGHTFLLEAISQVHPKYPSARFFFAGDGPQRSALEDKLVTLGLEKAVTLLSVRDDVPKLLAAADIFVQPSLWEGLSLALLEAMFAKLPVLATQVEGTISVAEDGINALLVPPKDVDQLANGLIQLIEEPSLRNRLGQAGYERAKARYSNDAMCSAYEALILGLGNGN